MFYFIFRRIHYLAFIHHSLIQLLDNYYSWNDGLMTKLANQARRSRTPRQQLLSSTSYPRDLSESRRRRNFRRGVRLRQRRRDLYPALPLLLSFPFNLIIPPFSFSAESRSDTNSYCSSRSAPARVSPAVEPPLASRIGASCPSSAPMVPLGCVGASPLRGPTPWATDAHRALQAMCGRPVTGIRGPEVLVNFEEMAENMQKAENQEEH